MDKLFRWNDWNLDHVAVHDVSVKEAEDLVNQAERPYPEQIGDDKWRVRGQTSAGRWIQVIFIFDPEDTVFVIHARELTDGEKRQYRKRKR